MPEEFLSGAQRVERLRSKGVQEPDVQRWAQDKRRRLREAGVVEADINRYFGKAEPDMSQEREHIKLGFERANAAAEEQGITIADDPLEQMAAGFQMSVSGLAARGELPGIDLGQDPTFMAEFMFQAGMLVGDLPAIVVGFIGGAAITAPTGAAIGAPAGPVGAAVGGTAAAFVGGGAGSAALPEFLRSAMIDQYEATMRGDGSIFTSKDWLARTGGILWDTGKAGTAGAIAGRAGSLTANTLTRLGAGRSTALLGRAATEVTAFTSALSGLEGRLPDGRDFLLGATFVIGLHGSSAGIRYSKEVVQRVSRNMGEIYKRTGITPAEQVQMADGDAAFRGEIMSADPNGKPRTPKFDAMARAEPDGAPPRVGPKPEPKIKVNSKGEGELVFPQKERPPLSDDQNAVLDRIVKQPKESLAEQLSPEKLYTEVLNEIHPLEKLEKRLKGEGFLFEHDAPLPSDVYRQTYGSAQRSGHFIRFGAIEFGTNKKLNDTSYLSAFGQVRDMGGTNEGFIAYRMAKFAVERNARGLDMGFDVEQMKRVVKDTSAIYEGAEQTIQAAKNGVLDYVEASGALTPESKKFAVELNKAHVPTRRLFGEESLVGKGKTGTAATVRNPLKRAKGSKKLIVDPYTTEIENIHAYVSIADQQRVMTTMVETLSKMTPEKAATIAVREKVPFKATKVHEAEVRAALEESGFDTSQIADGALDPFIVFRATNRSLARNQAGLMKNGKMEVWTFADPDIAALMRGGMEPGVAGVIATAAGKVAGLQRAGITGAPDFAIRNTLFRDQFTAATFGDFIPWIDMTRGIYSALKQDASYQRWIREGGAGTALTEMDTNYIQRDMRRLFNDTGVTGKIWNEMKHPIELTRKVQELLDAGVRLGAFERAQKRGKTVPEAVTQSRRIALDFAQRGTSAMVNTWSRATPFFRPSLLGVEQIVRGVKDNPKQVALRGATWITVPTIMNYVANAAVDEALKDDPDHIPYAQQPRWMRDLYWVMPPINGVRLRIPKPHFLGVAFGSAPERFMDWMIKDDPRAFKDLSETALGTLMPTFIPGVMAPVYEVTTGKSLFTGNSIIPQSLERASGYMQYTNHTSEVSKKLAQVAQGFAGTDLSPIILDRLVQGYLGTIGIEAIKLLDGAVGSGVAKPSKDFFDVPFVRSFIARHPQKSATVIGDFYDKYQALSKRSADLRLAMKRLNPTEARIASRHISAFVKVDQAARAVSNISNIIQLVNDHPKMKAEEKRAHIDNLYNTMYAIAKVNLKIMDAIVPVGEE